MIATFSLIEGELLLEPHHVVPGAHLITTHFSGGQPGTSYGVNGGHGEASDMMTRRAPHRRLSFVRCYEAAAAWRAFFEALAECQMMSSTSPSATHSQRAPWMPEPGT